MRHFASDGTARRPDGVRLEDRRRQAAFEVLDAGREPAVVAHALGVSMSTVQKWARAYRCGCEHALLPRTGSHAAPRLSAEETRHVMGLLRDSDPPDLGYEPALWSRDLVRRLISDELRTALSAAATTRLLQCRGITLRRPQAVISEPGLSSTDAMPGGDPPTAATGSKRWVTTITVDEVHADPAWSSPSAQAPEDPVTILTPATPRGAVRFAVRSGPLAASMLMEFLVQLSADIGGPMVVLGVTGHLREDPPLRTYLASTLGRVRVHPLTEGGREGVVM